jgi:thymidine kinase
MAKLYFYYSAMNAGKSTNLLQSSHNYRERGMNTLLLTPEIDHRAGAGKIASWIGLEAEARTFRQEDDLHALIEASEEEPAIACVLIDEAQFLTRPQVEQLAQVSDDLDIPVLCYGLRKKHARHVIERTASIVVPVRLCSREGGCRFAQECPSYCVARGETVTQKKSCEEHAWRQLIWFH